MSFIPVGYGEVTVEITIPGDAGPAQVVLGCEASALGSATNLDAAFQAILANAAGFAGLSGNWNTIAGLVARYSPSPGVVEISESVLNIPFQLTGSAPPPQVATLIKKVSGLAGRENRGRMYVPAINEAAIDGGGIIQAASVTVLQNSADTFLADCSSSSCPLHILHVNPADTPTAVQSLQVAAKVATQRRRLR